MQARERAAARAGRGGKRGGGLWGAGAGERTREGGEGVRRRTERERVGGSGGARERQSRAGGSDGK
eukprot:1402812-Pleurochrysis_carterae.AAC.2